MEKLLYNMMVGLVLGCICSLFSVSYQQAVLLWIGGMVTGIGITLFEMFLDKIKAHTTPKNPHNTPISELRNKLSPLKNFVAMYKNPDINEALMDHAHKQSEESFEVIESILKSMEYFKK